jgi:sensor histidine kinase YesM
MKIFVLAAFSYCLIVLFIYLFNKNYAFAIRGYLFFTAFASVFGILSYIPFFKSKNSNKYFLIVGSMVLLVCSVVSLIMYIMRDFPEETFGTEYIILYTGLTIEIVVFALGLGYNQSIVLKEKNESQKALINQMLENEKLKDKLSIQMKSDLDKLHKQIEEDKLITLKAQHKSEVADLKLTALRSQMNPHFIFNSLNSIKLFIINKDQKNAVHYLNKFSKLIRKILSSTREKEVTLKEEIETIELYVLIENIRFNGEINLEIQNEDQLVLSNYTIPSMLLQPFIENAIWHGLSNKEKDKNLILRVFKSNTHILIEIIDDGIGRKESFKINENRIHKRESLGIKLSNERLMHFAAHKEHPPSIVIEDAYPSLSKNVGTRVRISIPLK